MRKSLLVVAVAATAIGTPAVVSPASAAPDPNSVYVQNVASYGGTGCPQGTVTPAISDDGTQFTLTLGGLVARTGPGLPVTENRKTCQATVNLHAPRGLLSTLTVNVAIPGHIKLPAGTTASVTSTAYVTGQVWQAIKTLPFTGPVDQDYQLLQTVNVLGSLLPGPCSVLTMNFKAEARISGPLSSPAQLSVDSLGGAVAGQTVLAPPC